VSAAQLGYLVPPNPIYPQRSRRAGEEGKVVVRVLIDVAGRPAQVSVQGSSGHPELDQSAVSAVRAAQFRPYAEGGVPQAVWVLVPINFVLR
jgi:protein TonB